MKEVYEKIVIAIVAASLIFVIFSMALNMPFSFNAKKVGPGDKVKVEYDGIFDNGTIFETSEGLGPFEFTAGTGQMIPGFDHAVMGMKIGQEKEIRLQPSDAYGDYMPELVQEVALEQVPADGELEVGVVLAVTMPNGNQLPARIIKLTDDALTLDLNHPLAGQVLNFKFKVVDILP